MEKWEMPRRPGALPLRSFGRVAVAVAVLASSAALGLATLRGAAASEIGSAGSVAAEAKAAETVYPAAADAQNFNAGPGGWRGYQEYSAGCWVRGGTCPKIDNVYQKDGGKNGKGDGFLRFKGNSPAVYGLPWGQGSYSVWQSPEFTYTSGDAKSWKLDLDWRSTHVSYAIGWNGLQVEIVNSKNEVVRTAMPGLVSVPTNRWSHVSTPFDGDGVLKVGEQYRINVVQIDYYGPSAATLGHNDIDNVKLSTSTEEGARPVVKCRKDDTTNAEAVEGALDGGVGSFCGVTGPLGESLKPASKVVDQLSKQQGIAQLLESGQGSFVVIDKAAGQSAAWAVGRENIPSTDPRRLYMWLDGGNAGAAADFAVYFVVSNPERVIKETFGHPDGLAGAVNGVLEGQLSAGSEVLSDPVGEALDVDANWSMANVMWHVNTLLGGKNLPDGGLPLPGGLPLAMPDVAESNGTSDVAKSNGTSSVAKSNGTSELPPKDLPVGKGKLSELPLKDLPVGKGLPQLPAGR